MKLLNTKTFTLLLSTAAILSMSGCDGDGENGERSEKSLLTEGQPPIAVAEVEPKEIICPSDTSVRYDGSKSTDPDGVIVSYEWFVNDVPVSTLQKDEIADICSKSYQSGTYEVSLTVEDNDGNRATDMVEITVTNGPY